MPDSPRNLYALLIGIDTYEGIRPLKGCVQDVNSMKAYLNSLSEFTSHIHTLTSPGPELPTKVNIIQHITQHLSQARSGDVVLLYFAGHGVREITHIPAFQRVESDNCLATLVCYDTRIQSGPGMAGTTLADKELRYLLHTHIDPLGAHVVVITDCCHSGGNTRTLEGDFLLRGEDPETELGSRLARPKPIPARRYDGFLFHEEIPLEQLEPDSAILDEILPQARHIQLAACRDVEEAWEARRPDGSVGGYFTITLLDIIKRAGMGISYYELKTRTTNLMRSMKRKPQTPQIYTSGKDPNELYRNFLSGTPGQQPIYCNVTHNTREGWTINLGAIHGIPANAPEKAIGVTVSNSEGTTFLAKVAEVFPGYARITFSSTSPKEKETGLKGFVEGIAMKPITLLLKGDQEGINFFLETFQQNSINGLNPALELVHDEAGAQYVLTTHQNQYSITLPFDTKPLTEPVWDYSAGSAQLVYDYLIHISRWKFIQQLSNPDTQLHQGAPTQEKMYPVELTLFQKMPDGMEREIDLSKEQIELFLNQLDSHQNPLAQIRMKIVNHTDRELYCSLVYMSMSFASFPTLLAERGVWLGKGEEAEANDGNYLTIKREPYIDYYGWDQSQDFVKLIISTQEFDPMIMYLPELPKPPLSGTRGDDTRTAWGVEDPKSTPPEEDWSTQLFEIFTTVPKPEV